MALLQRVCARVQGGGCMSTYTGSTPQVLSHGYVVMVECRCEGSTHMHACDTRARMHEDIMTMEQA